MIHRGEVRSERHIVEVGIGLRRAEWCIDQLTILARQGQSPLSKEALKRVELAGREIVPKSARTAVRKESKAAIAQTEDLCRAPGTLILGNLHRFAFAKVVSSAIAPELRHLVGKFR